MEYKFFDANHLQDAKFKITLKRYLRYYLRKIIFYSYIKKFQNFVNTDNFFVDFFQKYPLATYVVIKCFCNKKFNAKERYEHILSDLSFMQRLYHQKNIYFWKEGLNIWNIFDKNEICYKLSLEMNLETSEEGFWALVLRNKDDARIYQSTFTITPNNDLLIASIQGSRDLAGGGGK